MIKVWNKAADYEYVLVDYAFENPYGDAWANAIFPAEDGKYSLISNLTTGGTEGHPGLSEVSLYPNPARDEVTVFNPSGANARIEIRNQLGNICLELESTGTKTRLDVSGISAGIYLVLITSKNMKVVKKLVVE